jgi:2-polyprenyl-3-methyl-5-hydroxy-6-metoxy-1,4-benzoquinol methylase
MPIPECPACGESSNRQLYGRYRDEEYFTSAELFDYWLCGACQTVYLHPLPLTRLREIYPSNYYSFAPRAGAGLVQRVKRWLDQRQFRAVLRRLGGAELRVLDVGGGNGWLLDLLREIDPRVRHTQIVDLDPAAAAQARAKGHEYACQRVEEFSSEHRFDLVLLMNLIEHVESPRRLLSKLAGLLAPDGLVLMKTPNVDALDARLFHGSYWAGLHVPRHWVLFTRESFGRALAGTGLRVREFAYTQGAPFWAASILAAWKRRGWVEISRERPAFYHPAFGPLAAAFAAFDLARAPFARTSQMSVLLEQDNSGGGSGLEYEVAAKQEEY